MSEVFCTSTGVDPTTLSHWTLYAHEYPHERHLLRHLNCWRSVSVRFSSGAVQTCDYWVGCVLTNCRCLLDTVKQLTTVNKQGPSVNKEYLSQIQLYSMFGELPVLSNTVLIITVCVKVANSAFLVKNKRTKWAELSRYYLYTKPSSKVTKHRV